MRHQFLRFRVLLSKVVCYIAERAVFITPNIVHPIIKVGKGWGRGPYKIKKYRRFVKIVEILIIHWSQGIRDLICIATGRLDPLVIQVPPIPVPPPPPNPSPLPHLDRKNCLRYLCGVKTNTTYRRLSIYSKRPSQKKKTTASSFRLSYALNFILLENRGGAEGIGRHMLITCRYRETIIFRKLSRKLRFFY